MTWNPPLQSAFDSNVGLCVLASLDSKLLRSFISYVVMNENTVCVELLVLDLEC